MTHTHSPLVHSPNKCQSSVAWSVVLQCADYLPLTLTQLPLNREHSGEDEYATHQTDNVVHDWSGAAQFDGSLVPLHESGVGQKRSKSSTWGMMGKWSMQGWWQS